MKNRFQHLLIVLASLLAMASQAQFTSATNNGAITNTGCDTAGGFNAVIPASTNTFDTGGNSAFTNSQAAGAPARFFRL